jgi:16S rRNA (cytidine1402-2'-O)-methyltransferase
VIAPAAKGVLYLVPAPLDFGCAAQTPLREVMPDATLESAARLTHWICENAKSARAYLKRVGDIHPLAVPLREQQIVELPREIHKKGDHDTGFDAKPLLASALAGHDVGLLSEAGMPAIADPGSSVVRAAHDLALRVVPLVGPGSLMLALAASGLNGQSFAFVGYLPQDGAQRTLRIQELDAQVHKTGQSQLFIETPYRNAALWDALLKTLRPGTRLSVASGLTMADATVVSRRAADWKQASAPTRNDVPAVFAIGR